LGAYAGEVTALVLLGCHQLRLELLSLLRAWLTTISEAFKDSFFVLLDDNKLAEHFFDTQHFTRLKDCDVLETFFSIDSVALYLCF